jgi:hypothetical protein
MRKVIDILWTCVIKEARYAWIGVAAAGQQGSSLPLGDIDRSAIASQRMQTPQEDTDSGDG